MICDETGRFSFVELKYSKTNAVKLSPHQVAWLTRHRHSSSWILVKHQPKADSKPSMHLYKASDAIQVKIHGLKHPSVFHSRAPFDWDALFDLICPI